MLNGAAVGVPIFSRIGACRCRFIRKIAAEIEIVVEIVVRPCRRADIGIVAEIEVVPGTGAGAIRIRSEAEIVLGLACRRRWQWRCCFGRRSGDATVGLNLKNMLAIFAFNFYLSGSDFFVRQVVFSLAFWASDDHGDETF